MRRERTWRSRSPPSALCPKERSARPARRPGPKMAKTIKPADDFRKQAAADPEPGLTGKSKERVQMIRNVNVELTSKAPMLMHADNIEWADAMEEWKNEPSNKAASKAGDDRTPPWRWIGCLNS